MNSPPGQGKQLDVPGISITELENKEVLQE